VDTIFSVRFLCYANRSKFYIQTPIIRSKGLARLFLLPTTNYTSKPLHFPLCYKLEGRGIESRWGGFFQLTWSFEARYGCGVDTTSIRNEHQESSWGLNGGRRVRLTTLPPYFSRLSTKCESLDVSLPYWPLRPLTRITLALPFLPSSLPRNLPSFKRNSVTRTIEHCLGIWKHENISVPSNISCLWIIPPSISSLSLYLLFSDRPPRHEAFSVLRLEASSEMFASCYCVLLMHPSRFNVIKIESLPLEVRKLPPQIFHLAVNSENEKDIKVKKLWLIFVDCESM
jgi:hypothetical protein